MHSHEALFSSAPKSIPKDEVGEFEVCFQSRLFRGTVRCDIAYMMDKFWVSVVVKEESSALGAGEKGVRTDQTSWRSETVWPDVCTVHERVRTQT